MPFNIGRHKGDTKMFNKDLMEVKKHGTESLPLMFYVGDFDKFDAYNAHWHKEIEIIHVLTGSMYVEINYEEFHIKEDEIVIFDKAVLHAIRNDLGNPKRTTYLTFVFNLDLLSCQILDFVQQEVVDKVHNQTLYLGNIITKNSEFHDDIVKQFHQIKKIFDEKGSYYEVDLKANLFKLIHQMLRQESTLSQQRSRRIMTSMSKAIDDIRTNLSIDFTIKELAGARGYSEAHFMREFKKNTGLTVGEYIQHERVKRACILLIETEKRVSDIANECGYLNTGYFNRVFLRQCKMTPLAYRRKHRLI